jgi:hypothetical protein
MLNLCKYFGNYLGVKSFRITFALEFKESLLKKDSEINSE